MNILEAYPVIHVFSIVLLHLSMFPMLKQRSPACLRAIISITIALLDSLLTFLFSN